MAQVRTFGGEEFVLGDDDPRAPLPDLYRVIAIAQNANGEWISQTRLPSADARYSLGDGVYTADELPNVLVRWALWFEGSAEFPDLPRFRVVEITGEGVAVVPAAALEFPDGGIKAC